MQQVGIRSVSIDDLCKELGISKKTFYVYFPSKDDLVDAMLHAHEEKVTKDVQHLVANKSVVQLIVDWTKITKQTEKSNHQTPPVLYDLKKYYPNLFKIHIKRVRRVMQQFLVQFLQKGQTEGIFIRLNPSISTFTDGKFQNVLYNLRLKSCCITIDKHEKRVVRQHLFA